MIQFDFNIDDYLQRLYESLVKEDKWQSAILTHVWSKEFPSEAGVYAFRLGTKLVYVGETGNLAGRMKDLLDSRHHSLRRTIGLTLFSEVEGFVPATTKKKFPQHIETLDDNHIRNQLKVAYLEVKLGRKELEELIERDKFEEGNKLNKRGKRKHR